MKFNLRSFIPLAVNAMMGRPVSISTAPSKATVAVDALEALAVDALLRPAEQPSFDVHGSARAPQSNAERSDVPIETSDPLIAREAAHLGIPVVPSITPLTPAELASATEGHLHMANKYAGVIADELLKIAEANKPAIVAEIAALEGGAEAFILNAAKNAAQKAGGPVATLFSIGEPQIKAAIDALVAKEGPEVAYAFIDAELHKFAVSLGG